MEVNMLAGGIAWNCACSEKLGQEQSVDCVRWGAFTERLANRFPVGRKTGGW